MLATVYGESKRFRHDAGFQYELFQFIPPELPLASDVPCCNEKGSWDAEALKRWFGIVKVVDVPVVKRDGYRPMRKLPAGQRVDDILEAHRVEVPGQHFNLFNKVVRSDTQ